MNGRGILSSIRNMIQCKHFCKPSLTFLFRPSDSNVSLTIFLAIFFSLRLTHLRWPPIRTLSLGLSAIFWIYFFTFTFHRPSVSSTCSTGGTSNRWVARTSLSSDTFLYTWLRSTTLYNAVMSLHYALTVLYHWAHLVSKSVEMLFALPIC